VVEHWFRREEYYPELNDEGVPVDPENHTPTIFIQFRLDVDGVDWFLEGRHSSRDDCELFFFKDVGKQGWANIEISPEELRDLYWGVLKDPRFLDELNALNSFEIMVNQERGAILQHQDKIEN